MATTTNERVINFDFIPSRGSEPWGESVQRVGGMVSLLIGFLLVAVVYVATLEVFQITSEVNAYLESNPLANALTMGVFIAMSSLIAYLLANKFDGLKKAKVARLKVEDSARLSQVLNSEGYATIQPVTVGTLSNAVFVDTVTGEEFVSRAGGWVSGNVTIYLTSKS